MPETTVASAVLLLVQLPPPEPSDKDVVPPTHTDSVPVIDAGSGFTVTVMVLKQPVGSM